MDNLSTPFDGFKKKIVAVDFDQVISDNHQGWLQILYLFKQIGYEVIVVTYRSPRKDAFELDFLEKAGYTIYFTNHVAKKDYLYNKGIYVDIWIDDHPLSILENNV